jgi:hypothetical protein
LWEESKEDSRLLRRFARPLNNALALASQVVEEKHTRSDQQSWVPNIVIKGKLYHKMPFSLMPPQGNMPRFAQIYVYNPEQDEGTKANT